MIFKKTVNLFPRVVYSLFLIIIPPMLQNILDRIFGSYNQKQLKKLDPLVQQVNLQEESFQNLSDEALKQKFSQWKIELTANPEKIEDYLVPVFAGVKNAARKLCGKSFEVRGKDVEWNMTHYDVQILGGIILHQGNITEMKTGEGKTLVCTLPVILNALTGKGVHVITVNDYLAQRDCEWITPLYEFCGLSTGVIVHGKNNQERRDAYNSDITYGTNNEFGFDYLRDNMAQRTEDLVQRELNFTIVDEVDSILIDESRTPLIISAPAEESTEKYSRYAEIIPQLVKDEDYNIDLKQKNVTLSEKGIEKLEGFLGTTQLFTEKGFEEVHHIEQALKANVIFVRDKDYVVRDNQVIIVDEFTGRLMPGRRYSDGLHQSLEAKEGVAIQRESKTLATITFQNYFRLYNKLSGMTGTAETEAEEFGKIYKVDTLVIPTNVPIARQDLGDKIFKNLRGKFTCLARDVKVLHEKGQPILIGTINIDTSEMLSGLLTKEGIPHEILNAKQHEREAEIVAKAGDKGSVTIATNMAGRGTDIKLSDEVKALGGLAVLGTERHESRRIDNQLRGRSGRQGDPGFSQFYVSMEDELLRRFGGERMQKAMEMLRIPEDEAIETRMFSRQIESAQKKVEGHHFDMRKHLVQYDDVMNVHREKIYVWRRKFLGSESIQDDIEQITQELIQSLVESHAPSADVDSRWDQETILTNVQSLYAPTTEALTLEELEAFHHRDDMIESVRNYLLGAWDKKRQSLPTENAEEIAKYVILKSIDEFWLDHIDQMTQLRDRVALSGYAQRDPIMEYRREGFLMFKKVLYDVRFTALQNLLRVRVEGSFEFEAADYSGAQTNEKDIETSLRNTGEYGVGDKADQGEHFISANPGRSIAAEKLGEKYANIGRNDACPCGSGKKFKKCHGQNI